MGDSVAVSVGVTASVGVTVSVGVAAGSVSAANAAGSNSVPMDLVSAEVIPGSTRLTSSPVGSPALAVPSSRTTCTSTPSDGPTHSGSEAPRMPGSTPSGGSTPNSRSCQALHSPVSRLRVRTCAVPSICFLGPVQETPSSENCFVLVRGSSRS